MEYTQEQLVNALNCAIMVLRGEGGGFQKREINDASNILQAEMVKAIAKI